MTSPPDHSPVSAGLPLGGLCHLSGLSVVDVVRGEVRKTSLTVAGGRIVGMDQPMPDDAEVLDLDGCWACPSLVDMHAHVTFEARAHYPDTVAFSFDDPPEVAAARGVQSLTEAMRCGICLIRDVGGRQDCLTELRRWMDGGLFVPELVTSGPPLCRPGGHGSAFGQHAASVEEVGRLVARHRASGHEWLKIMNGPELWPEPVLADVLALARQAGLRTAVHAFTAEGIGAAVRCGADTVEHGLAGTVDVVEEAQRRGTMFVPTVYCSWISLRPRFLRTQTRTEIGHLEYWHDYLERCRPVHLAGGLPVLPGTDAGCAPCSFDDYLDELAVFERWGMDPMTVLECASLRGAACLGRAADFGSIDVGKWANLIITEQDPTAGTDCLRHPLLVLYKGAGVANTLGERWP